MDNFQNDPAFEAVLRNAGTIDPTDFFVVSPPEGGSVGFPPGIAAQLVISKFKKWQEFSAISSKHKQEIPPSFTEVVRTETVASTSKGSGSPPPPCYADAIKKVGSQNASSKVGQKKADKDKGPETSSKNWNSHNGNQSDKYSWSQSIKELDVHVVVDKTVKTKRDVKVEILTKSIRITTTSNNEVVDWILSDPIIKDESYWSLYPGETVFLSLQKVKEKWWDHLFEGEEPIDRNKIEAVRPMEELADDEQAKIHELVFNQEQKLKGLPTSDETKLHEVMKKAWDVEGSPFKGQPFDPSKVHLANSNSMGFPPGAQPPY
ncbi:NudC domain-containing protein 3 [Orchesella cincta]|uniref:NudC domain-containing protein 3 n=1 Tax=Orchesella cincta TaxID=48709 RepID=A0A1D2N7E0_ORCCI|nr:NudC domain-containing protein 3 [Orchesella cincta]